MPWVYLDDQFPDHPKVAAAGGDAAWLFVCGLAYCKRFGTAGQIPASQVGRLSDRKQPMKLASRLVEVDLWHTTSEGFEVHDYALWNKASESRSEAGRKGAAARWDSKRNGPANGKRNANAPPSHMAQDAHIPNPIPSESLVVLETHDGDPQPVDDDDQKRLADETLRILAVRHLERRETEKGQVRNREAWLVEDMRRTRAEHVSHLPSKSMPSRLSAAQLADWLEPARLVNGETASTVQPFEPLQPVEKAPVAVAKAAIAGTRAQLRGMVT